MAYRVLTPDQVDAFVERGWTRLEEAFPRQAAAAARDCLWERLAERGVVRDKAATWKEPLVHLKEAYDAPPFQACNTERLADAIEDLVGPGRWRGRGQRASWGWWPVNFAVGADRPWDVPSGGWHWDGQHFRHFVDAPNQGLLLLCIFSDIRSRGGATLIAEGSHQIVADFLDRHPDGLELGEAIRTCAPAHPWLADLTGAAAAPEGAGPRIERFMERVTRDAAGRGLRVVEGTAQAGDVLLCHPFLFHAASPNHSGVPRFLCNRTTPLHGRLRVRGPAGSDLSPVEVSVGRALALTGRPA